MLAPEWRRNQLYIHQVGGGVVRTNDGIMGKKRSNGEEKVRRWKKSEPLSDNIVDA